MNGIFRTWHGSPYEFEKFDLSQSGSGEGNSIFGWGIYCSETKEVGEAYPEFSPFRWIRRYFFSLPSSGNYLDYDNTLNNQPSAVQTILHSIFSKIDFSKNYIFELAPPLQFWKLEKQMSYQQLTGHQIYQALKEAIECGAIPNTTNSYNMSEAASRFLAKNHIIGMRYLDRKSRSASSGSCNYVIFDQDVPTIIGKEATN